MTNAVSVRAHAKVNPALRVLGRRADGYHELETVLVALELADVVTVRETAGGGVTVRTTGPRASSDIVDGPDHLAARGAALALEVLGSSAGLEVVVEKHVPSRAGLGGGSADAAAAALAALTLLGPGGGGELDALHERCTAALGALGADCPFFLHGPTLATGAGLGAGRGDELVALPAPDWEVLLVTPDVACSTPAVYQAMTDAERGSVPAGIDGARELLAAGAEAARGALVNDLAPAAARAEPGLIAWTGLLREAGLDHALLAGSGSSHFALFAPGTGDAERARDRVLAAADARGLTPRLCEVTGIAGCTLTPLDRV